MLFENRPARIHLLGHVFMFLSLLILASYCVFGGITGNLSGGTLVLLLILAIPMHCFTHLIFWGMVKSGDFSMLAGYDAKVKYDTEGTKRYVVGLDFLLGSVTVSFLLIIAATALFLPETKVLPVLLFGYIISFVAGIFFMNYKFGEQIYIDPNDAKKAKRGLPSSAIFMVVLLLAVIVFGVLFELNGYENNDASVFPMLGMMFVSIGLSLGGYLAESARLKKTDEEKPLFGKAFIICSILTAVAIAAMALL